MEKRKPVPENVGQKGTNLDVVLKMLRGEIETEQISINELPLWRAAGLASGFTVEQIAKPGEEYPHNQDYRDRVPEGGLGIYEVRPGYIAIAITRPEGHKGVGNIAFWQALEELRQKKATQSSKSSAKS